MKTIRQLRTLIIITFSALLFACGGGGGSSTAPEPEPHSSGVMTFNLDLASLRPSANQSPRALSVGMPITAVNVSLTREGYATIETNLAVNNDVATGRIDNLATGYWHVLALVYSGDVQIYQGESDVNIIAGAEVACRILFDPIIVEPTTGSVGVTVGMNPLPGYRVMGQTVSTILQDEVNNRFYILDASAPLIGVYDADTLNRVKDIPLAQAPESIALDAATAKIFLGYPSGQVYTLDVATGQVALLGDALGRILALLPLQQKYLFLGMPGRWDMEFKTMDRTSGQVAATVSPWYSMTSFLFNAQNGKIYAHHTNVSPTDIHRFSVDLNNGVVTDNGDSTYHGDYGMGTPLRLIKSGTRLATSSGNLFTSSSISSEDLLYAGSLGYPYIDLFSDDAKGYLYLLNRDGITKLLILDQATYFLLKTVELQGNPKRVFSTPESIIVFTEQNGAWYARVIAKTSLDL